MPKQSFNFQQAAQVAVKVELKGSSNTSLRERL